MSRNDLPNVKKEQRFFRTALLFYALKMPFIRTAAQRSRKDGFWYVLGWEGIYRHSLRWYNRAGLSKSADKYKSVLSI